MNKGSDSLINSVINLMGEREQAKKAKRERRVYRGSDPDFVIDNTDYYIKTHLYILQSAEKGALGEVTAY